MWKRILAVVLLGILSAGYALLYDYLKGVEQGIFVFFSLMTVIAVARARKEA